LWRDIRDFHDPGAVTRRTHLLRALKRWQGRPPAAVLDYGCGAGRHSFLAAARWPGARVVGVDVDEAVLEAGRRRAETCARGRVSFTPAVSFPGRRGSFDLALCIDVLEHIDDELGALRRMAYVLKENALLVLHTPALNQRRYWGVADNDGRHAGGEEFGHVREGYDEEELERLLRRAGFVPRYFRSTVGKAAAWLSDLDYRLARRGLQPLRAPTYLAGRGAAWWESIRGPAAGRGIMVVARRAGGRRL